MGELKDDIGVLESKVGQLKVQYEQYFMKQLKLEPLRLREEVERLILFHSNRPISGTSLKFRFNSAVARFNSYKQYWLRVVRAIENGTYVAGKSETGAFSGTSLGNGQTQLRTPPPPKAAPPQPAPEERVSPEPKPASTGANGEIKELYKKYIEAKRQCNEPVDSISYDAFEKTIRQSAQKAKEAYKTDSVDLKITIKDGKAKLTIAPKAK